MTKYILCGGYSWKAPDGGKVFCEELLKGFQEPVRILECMFATPLQLGEGLGLVPIKVLVHYQSNYNTPNIHWSHALSELQAYKEELPVVTLREGEFKVIG